ncbi:MAG TPA: hypothetical protein DF296_05740 [Candidatus Margulisbacteria bacterium]|nr:MAG: hypothetical protein A2X41_12285 [Candidatus Margulisbacteria bacterium GWE2_39_32]HCT84683.1 hypothetical protein [Candidatus Margulisiibacteriota bacterium]
MEAEAIANYSFFIYYYNGPSIIHNEPYPVMYRKYYIKTLYILTFVICISGVIITQKQTNSYYVPPKNKLEQNSGAKVNPDRFKYFTFGFNTLIADVIFMNIRTSLPTFISNRDFTQNNKFAAANKQELKRDLQGLIGIDINTIKNQAQIAPEPNEEHHHDKKEEHDHKNALTHFLEHIGFYFAPEEELDAVEESYYSDDRITHAYYLYDTLTTIDPHYIYPYTYAFTFFSFMLNRPELSEKLLLKGIESNLRNPIFYHMLAANAVIYDINNDLARQYLLSARKFVPKKDAVMIHNLLTLIDKSQNPYFIKLYILNNIYASIKDEEVKKKIKKLIEEFEVKSTLLLLNKSISVYYSIHNSYPSNINDLLNSRILDDNTTKLAMIYNHYYEPDTTQHVFVLATNKYLTKGN